MFPVWLYQSMAEGLDTRGMEALHLIELYIILHYVISGKHTQ